MGENKRLRSKGSVLILIKSNFLPHIAYFKIYVYFIIGYDFIFIISQ